MKTFEKNNLTIAVNVLYANNKKIYPAYVSKQRSNHKKQVILLMIPNRKGRHYLAVKKLSALLRGIMSKHDGDFYYLNCLHSHGTKRTLESDKEYVMIKTLAILCCLLRTLRY